MAGVTQRELEAMVLDDVLRVAALTPFVPAWLRAEVAELVDVFLGHIELEDGQDLDRDELPAYAVGSVLASVQSAEVLAAAPVGGILAGDLRGLSVDALDLLHDRGVQSFAFAAYFGVITPTGTFGGSDCGCIDPRCAVDHHWDFGPCRCLDNLLDWYLEETPVVMVGE